LTSITGSSSITKRSKLRRSRSQLQPHETITGSFGFTDSSSEEEEEEEYEPEENRPIEARIRWHNSPVSTSPLDHVPNTTHLGESREQEILNKEAQAQLAAEVRKANVEVAKKRRRAAYDRKHAPIGMRLTMTSRSGYFQDRIISPTMMRAMAILYIGPHLNPDFASDYHISPILTPAQVLAKFPPLLLQCGEKDPLVDDTIIFAGRVREAKRQRREELRGALAQGRDHMGGAELQKLEDELESLGVESDEDWLQMHIFSGWSHGYLQMPSLMPEAQVAIDDLATWIEGVFATVSPVDSRVPLNVSSLQSEVEGTGSHFLSHVFPWAFRDGAGGPASNGELVRVHLDSDTAPRVRILAPSGDESGGTEVESIAKVAKDDEAARREKMRKGIAAYNGRTEGVSCVATLAESGQIITESELMRRRRLLDSDIFVRE